MLVQLNWPGHLIASGLGPGTAWLVTRCFEGPSTWDAFASFREDGTGRMEGLAAAVALSETWLRSCTTAAGFTPTSIQTTESTPLTVFT
ncbi:hypothetical protein G3I76_73455 [Streptomyces sp. SID11233]|nr:hypothetical protein [Streptomyces sp. SID11233]